MVVLFPGSPNSVIGMTCAIEGPSSSPRDGRQGAGAQLRWSGALPSWRSCSGPLVIRKGGGDGKAPCWARHTPVTPELVGFGHVPSAFCQSAPLVVRNTVALCSLLRAFGPNPPSEAQGLGPSFILRGAPE